jgi:hypothetical protein
MNRADFIAKFKSFTLEGWTSYVLIAVGLLAFLAVIGLGMEYIIKNRADHMTQTHVLALEKPVECSVAGSKDKVDFINSQRREIGAFGNSHRYDAIRFFSFYYTSYLVFTIFGLIAAISLAVITKKGIDQVGTGHLIAVFLVCTAIVVLYQGSSSVFQLKANLDSNAKLAVSYGILADQINTYCATGKLNVKDPNEALASAVPKFPEKPANANSTPQVTPSPSPQAESPVGSKIQPFYAEPNGDQFINFVAWQMEHLRSLSIAIDETKVSPIDNKRFLLQ